MTIHSFILKKLFVKMDQLQDRYDAGLIAPGSAECLDLIALKELKTQLRETADFVTSLALAASRRTNETRH